MAQEVDVYEMTMIRSGMQVRPFPPLAKQILDFGVASAAFNRSTNLITVVCSVKALIEIGANPTGSGMTFPCEADTAYDFAVVAGHKIYAAAHP